MRLFYKENLPSVLHSRYAFNHERATHIQGSFHTLINENNVLLIVNKILLMYFYYLFPECNYRHLKNFSCNIYSTQITLGCYYYCNILTTYSR